MWSLKRAIIVCHGAGDVNLHVVMYKLTGIFVFCYCLYETKNYDKLSVLEEPTAIIFGIGPYTMCDTRRVSDERVLV